MKFNKKRFAKEWLIFLGTIVFALLLPLLIAIIGAIIKGKFPPLGKFYVEFFDAMFDGDYTTFIALLLPYALVQFVRSIIWSIRTIKSKNN
jgi:hypothetical protein